MGDRASGTQGVKLRLAPAPGTTVELEGRLVGCSSEIVVVALCLRAESWLAVSPGDGRLLAVMQPDDLLDVQKGEQQFRVPARMTTLPAAPSPLVMVCGPPLAG